METNLYLLLGAIAAFIFLVIIISHYSSKLAEKDNLYKNLKKDREDLFKENASIRAKLDKYASVINAEEKASQILKEVNRKSEVILKITQEKHDSLVKSIDSYEQRLISIIQIEKDLKKAVECKVNRIEKDYEFLVFDCETTGLPGNGAVYIIQLSWIALDKQFNIIKEEDYYIKPPIPIPAEATAKNNITNEMVESKGTPLKDVILKFHSDVLNSVRIVAHNFEFDADRIDYETKRAKVEEKSLYNFKNICTMQRGTKYCKIPGNYGDYKWPTLKELADYTGVNVSNKLLHDSMYDCKLTARCLKVMVNEKFIKIKGINY